MDTADAPGLGEHEQRYLSEVERELRDVDPSRRRTLLELAEANLDERPDASSWSELVDELGEPEASAAQLRGGSPRRPIRRWLTGTSTPAQLTAAVVVEVVATATPVAWQWYCDVIADAGLGNDCVGAWPADHRRPALEPHDPRRSYLRLTPPQGIGSGRVSSG